MRDTLLIGRGNARQVSEVVRSELALHPWQRPAGEPGRWARARRRPRERSRRASWSRGGGAGERPFQVQTAGNGMC